MKKLLYLVLLLTVVSCEDSLQEQEALGENAEIVGTWVEDSYDMHTDATLLERSSGLDSARYGFIVKADGTFTERKNAGWCATPPISYTNYTGTWEAVSDSLLDITVGFWGGTMTYQMRIVFLEGDQLGVRYFYSENRVDTK